jgi:uncharacterized protein YacL
MLLYIIRALFILAMAALAMSFAEAGNEVVQAYAVVLLLGAIIFALVILVIDILVPHKSLPAIGGMFFGIVVGLAITWGLIQVLNLLIDISQPTWQSWSSLISTFKIVIGVVTCYLCTSFILQTKDDIRFVIPYVDLSKQTRGTHPLIIDTSVLVDGRFAEVCETSIVDAPVVIPQFVLTELHAIADSADRLKRNRGRRGLDILRRLQTNDALDVSIVEGRSSAGKPVDERLVLLAKKMDGRVITNDYNLNKIAQIHGVTVINLNDLANAMKPTFLPGEHVTVKIIKPGEEPGQGVGYLDDGTMVVVESGRGRIGESVLVNVTSVLQTSAGRMVFGRPDGPDTGDRHQRAHASS